MGKWTIPWNSFYGLKVSKVCSHQPRLCAAIISTYHFACVIACNDSFKSALCRWFTVKSFFFGFFWDSGEQETFCAYKINILCRSFSSISLHICPEMGQLTYSGHASVRGMRAQNCLFCLRRAVLGTSLRTDGVTWLCQIYIHFVCIYVFECA